ncbi:MAG TPA: creatininase family protein [Aestuariivirgaceae bacterium]|jgi:creatinine amidohydrolase
MPLQIAQWRLLSGILMRWEELSVPAIEALDRDRTILLIPLGSVEQHGRHLPIGTDTILATAICRAAAEQAPNAAVLPPPWYGFSQHHMRFAGSVTLRPETMLSLVEDIVESIVAHGFRRVVLMNGHGGNIGLIDVLSAKLGHRHYRRARVVGVTYFQLAHDAIAKLRRSAPGGMGHACEFETAMIQHLRPELVFMDKAQATYPDTGTEYVSTDLLGGSRVRAYNDFGDLSESGTLGDPSLASPEAGAKFYAAVVAELTRFLRDFSGWPIPGSTGS